MQLLGLFLISVGVIIGDCGQNLSDGCGQEKYVSYLDMATELIVKAKDGCSTCLSSQHAGGKMLDCEELMRSGQSVSKVYTIWPKSRVTNSRSLQVYCDMETDGGGWTVIQRRGDFLRPKDYFYQDWNAYKNGFGDIERDFWLGNDNIFAISNQKLYSVRFDLKDVEGSKRYALYDTFWIDDEDHKYILHINGYSGDAGDSMVSSHNKQKFSTKDQDNDRSNNTSCSETYKGGWWYNRCYSSNLNGLYLRGIHDRYSGGVVWYAWKGLNESMDSTEIKLRSKDFRKTIKNI